MKPTYPSIPKQVIKGTDIWRFICSHLSKRWNTTKRLISKSETGIHVGRLVFANSHDLIEITLKKLLSTVYCKHIRYCFRYCFLIDSQVDPR